MGKQSKPGQSKPIQSAPTLTPEERGKGCELAVLEICKHLQCTPIFTQRTIDGQLHPIQNVPIVLCFVPNENIKQGPPANEAPPVS